MKKTLLSILGITLLTGCSTTDIEYFKGIPKETKEVLFGYQTQYSVMVAHKPHKLKDVKFDSDYCDYKNKGGKNE